MKKYKDLSVVFASKEEALRGLNEVKGKCSSGHFVFDEELEKQYAHNDDVAHIIVSIPSFPNALLILYVSNCKLSVINVIPYQQSADSIDRETYNNIIDEFYFQVLLPIFGEESIEKTSAEISMKDLIPKSFESLDNWAHCPGAPNAPYGHQDDLYMWFKFLCNLRKNQEELSSGNLEQWLREDVQWENDVVNDAIIRYETETKLLDYYDIYNS